MDEAAERAKLEILDLTEDVIEMILEKKRKAYQKRVEAIIDVIPDPIEELADIEEPTFYPPDPSPGVDWGRNPKPVEVPVPVVSVPPMDRSLVPIIRNKILLPWQKKKYPII